MDEPVVVVFGVVLDGGELPGLGSHHAELSRRGPAESFSEQAVQAWPK